MKDHRRSGSLANPVSRDIRCGFATAGVSRRPSDDAALFGATEYGRRDPCRGQAAVGSLAGAVRPEKRGRVDHASISVGTETSRSVQGQMIV